jgi:hypothetical protein
MTAAGVPVPADQGAPGPEGPQARRVHQVGCPRAADGRRDRRGRLHPASGLGTRHRSSAWATPRWSSTTPRPNWAPPATSSRSVSAPTRTCSACSPRAAEVCWPVPGRARSSSTTERGRRSAAGTLAEICAAGGEEEAEERCREVFAAFATHVVTMGPVGTGQAGESVQQRPAHPQPGRHRPARLRRRHRPANVNEGCFEREA